MADFLKPATRETIISTCFAVINALRDGDDQRAGLAALSVVKPIVADVKAAVGETKWGIWIKLFVGPFINSLLR